MPYRSSLSLQSIASRLSSNDFHNFQADRTTVPSHVPLAQLSVAEAIDDPGAGTYVSFELVVYMFILEVDYTLDSTPIHQFHLIIYL